ncbi:MAG TPA: TIGR02588 family protein [Longimicrobiaceae bacterium]|nr:TIGR02588 family protein [Longimicrobiaceae bacterium]
MDGEPKGRRSGSHEEPSVWEWVTAAGGTLLVLGTVGLMLSEALRGESTPPDVVVSVERVEAVENGFRVEFRVENRGGETAAGVKVEGEVRGGGGTTETSEMTLDYIPGRATRRGGLFFREDPRGSGLTLRASGYAEP